MCTEEQLCSNTEIKIKRYNNFSTLDSIRHGLTKQGRGGGLRILQRVLQRSDSQCRYLLVDEQTVLGNKKNWVTSQKVNRKSLKKVCKEECRGKCSLLQRYRKQTSLIIKLAYDILMTIQNKELNYLMHILRTDQISLTRALAYGILMTIQNKKWS